MPIFKVKKRDGVIVDFDRAKIEKDIGKAVLEVGERDETLASRTTLGVCEAIERRFADEIPGVEDIQDLVEKVLMNLGFTEVAKGLHSLRK